MNSLLAVSSEIVLIGTFVLKARKILFKYDWMEWFVKLLYACQNKLCLQMTIEKLHTITDKKSIVVQDSHKNVKLLWVVETSLTF